MLPVGPGGRRGRAFRCRCHPLRHWSGPSCSKGQAPDLVTLPALRSLLRFLPRRGPDRGPAWRTRSRRGRGYPRPALPRAAPASSASGRCWRPATARLRAEAGAVTTRSCWSWPASRCGAARSPGSTWATSTGGQRRGHRPRQGQPDRCPAASRRRRRGGRRLPPARPALDRVAGPVRDDGGAVRPARGPVGHLPHQPRLRPRRGGQVRGRTGCATPPPASCRSRMGVRVDGGDRAAAAARPWSGPRRSTRRSTWPVCRPSRCPAHGEPHGEPASSTPRTIPGPAPRPWAGRWPPTGGCWRWTSRSGWTMPGSPRSRWPAALEWATESSMTPHRDTGATASASSGASPATCARWTRRRRSRPLT